MNRTYREDVLDACLFASLDEARDVTVQWLDDYNNFLPHDALGGISPVAYDKEITNQISASKEMECSEPVKGI